MSATLDLVEEFRSLNGVEGDANDGSGHESIGEINQKCQPSLTASAEPEAHQVWLSLCISLMICVCTTADAKWSEANVAFSVS